MDVGRWVCGVGCFSSMYLRLAGKLALPIVAPNRRPYSSPVLVDRKRKPGRQVRATSTVEKRAAKRFDGASRRISSSLSRSLSRSSSLIILVLILVPIFVDNDRDNDQDKDCDNDGAAGRPFCQFHHQRRGEDAVALPDCFALFLNPEPSACTNRRFCKRLSCPVQGKRILFFRKTRQFAVSLGCLARGYTDGIPVKPLNDAIKNDFERMFDPPSVYSRVRRTKHSLIFGGFCEKCYFL